MNILLVCCYFPPDVGSSAILYHRLGGELVKMGHDVTVLTTIPRYNAQGDLSRYRGRRWMREKTDNGMDVVRVDPPTPPRQLLSGRAIWQFGLSFGVTVAGLLNKPHDVALVYSPPMPLGLAAIAIRMVKKTPFVFGVQDLFPQSAIDLGLLSNKPLIRVFEAMERFVYKRADALTVHSPANADHVTEKSADSNRVHVVPNWVDTEAIMPNGSGDEFRRRHGVRGRFVVSFGGVMGWSQDMNVILNAAHTLREHADIEWLIIGDGVQKESAIQKAKELRLNNVKFIPMLPPAEYNESLYASDICLATLVGSVKTPVVPSKIVSIMAAAKPAVVAMDTDGDAPKLVLNSGSGFALPPGDHAALAQAVLDLTSNPDLRRKMGDSGRTYAERHLSVPAAAQKYVSIFESIV